ncbi:MAG: hypothetical protein LBP52_06825 [Burkholderiaceae bacterium]|nr:hypothetical protein [Burkholderiaceae bacterium]
MNVFPFLGSWNLVVYFILRDAYPPTASPEHITAEEIERDQRADFSGQTLWEIICLEAVDTEYSHIYHAKACAEAARRGLAAGEFKKARKFMWLTAGWLNFKLMMWDWVHLDENDVLKAVDMQRERHLISEKKWRLMRTYVDQIKQMDMVYNGSIAKQADG